jgi:hypothetical protein
MRSSSATVMPTSSRSTRRRDGSSGRRASTITSSRALPQECSADPAGELDPALLARAQIDELVRSNPRRVGEILSRWASEETAGAR